ncbi:cell division protein FtsA [Lactobacillus bombicola]|uniref:cell division protein FtsA n=1 Tax=Lactobacillus bombicola TaxID=1505723 RepID=UPI000E58A3A5|nr:cell division protein FtsA [Lactobacillus bombicola]RHW50429.1 cell division protein FtsA [Lactobacillus bombicola]
MDDTNLLVGLDIGTTAVKAVVADAGKVIGAVAVNNKGMRHGNIVDIDETASAIKQALKEIATKTNAHIYRVVTGIPVGMLQLEKASDLINVSDSGQEVGNSDVKRVISIAIKSGVKSDREPIAFFPNHFVIDGTDVVDDPRKMIAHSLAVQGIVLTAPTSPLHNIKKAIERAGYQNNFFVPTPLAIASVALQESERKFGSIILDLGGGVTTATVIRNNQIVYANVDYEGGSDISDDISVVLSTSKKDANQIKLDYGYANPALASVKNEFAVNSVGSNGQQMVDEVYLSKIINARVMQIIGRIKKGLAQHDALKLPGGVIITGGSSLLQGYAEIIANAMNVKARVYYPDQIGMRNPVYSVAFGIVNYAYKMSDIDFLITSSIYGNDILDQNEKMVTKKSKRPTSANETKVKEEYNRRELSKQETNSQSKLKNNMHNNEKGIRNFFKKFFD